VLVGAAGSATAALGGLAIALRVPGREEAEARDLSVPDAAAGPEPAAPFRSWVILYALSGFISLSLEMVWFRVLDITAKGAAFTFGTLLGVYLL